MAPPLRAWTGGLSVVLGLWVGVGVRPSGRRWKSLCAAAAARSPPRSHGATGHRRRHRRRAPRERSPGASPARRDRYPGGPREQEARPRDRAHRAGCRHPPEAGSSRGGVHGRPPPGHAASGSSWTSSGATGTGGCSPTSGATTACSSTWLSWRPARPGSSRSPRTSATRTASGPAPGRPGGRGAASGPRRTRGVVDARQRLDAPDDRERRARGAGFLPRPRSRSGRSSAARCSAAVPTRSDIWGASPGRVRRLADLGRFTEAAELTAALGLVRGLPRRGPGHLVARSGRRGDARARSRRRGEPQRRAVWRRIWLLALAIIGPPLVGAVVSGERALTVAPLWTLAEVPLAALALWALGAYLLLGYWMRRVCLRVGLAGLAIHFLVRRVKLLPAWMVEWPRAGGALASHRCGGPVPLVLHAVGHGLRVRRAGEHDAGRSTPDGARTRDPHAPAGAAAPGADPTRAGRTRGATRTRAAPQLPERPRDATIRRVDRRAAVPRSEHAPSIVHTRKRPTFDMSGSRRQAKPAGGCPVDGGVRRHIPRAQPYFANQYPDSTGCVGFAGA